MDARLPALEATLLTLALDATAARVIGGLEDAGVRVLLLKGPVTAGWLYDRAQDHPYTDVDLLVAPTQRQQAEWLLAQMGFADHHASVMGIHRPRQESAWVGQQGLVVDLHTGLDGVPQERAEEAWQRFWATAVPFTLQRRQVRALCEPARLLHLGLHAARLSSGPKARRDLARGLARFPVSRWREAAQWALSVGAHVPFAAGLSSSPEGQGMLSELGMGYTPTVVSLLHARGCLPESVAIAELMAGPRSRRWSTVRHWFSTPGAATPVSWRARTAVAVRLPPAVAQLVSARVAVRRNARIGAAA